MLSQFKPGAGDWDIGRVLATIGLAVSQALSVVEGAVQNPEARWPRFYLWLLVGFAFVLQVVEPIVYGDSDMWYHLAGGRRFWETGEVPVTGYFSFIAEDRTWINYYWGFQAAIAGVYDTFGYQGLVLVRTILVSASLFLATRLIGGVANYNVAAALLAGAVYLILEARGYQLRPHLVSYFMIVFFLLILERCREFIFILPFATIVWVNMHGVEWVIGALICGAYVVEYFVDRYRQAPQPHGLAPWQVAALFACSLTLFINPHGWRVLLAPFAQSPDIGLFIQEMQPLGASAYYSIFFVGVRPLGATVFAILFLLSLFAIVRLLQERRLRLAHLILWLGATVLVTRGVRFAVEWTLLSVPLLAAMVGSVPRIRTRVDRLRLSTVVIVALLVAPSSSFSWSNHRHRPYPFDSTGLPVGSTNFLRKLDSSGRLLLLNANVGGYVHFRLYPHFQIYADMELPPFVGEDFQRLIQASRNAASLGRLVQEHDVDFVAVSLDSPVKADLKQLPNLVPIFFDDVQVLYTNRGKHPEVADRYEIRSVDPFDLNKGGADLTARIAALRELHALEQSGSRVNNALAALLIKDNRYEEALKYAKHHVQVAPTDPNAYLLLGSSLEYLERCDEAIAHFERALAYSGEATAREVNLHLGSCHYTLGDLGSAYSVFRRSVNPYIYEEYPETLYQFSVSSLAVGDIDRARRLALALLLNEGESESAVAAKAQALLDDIAAGKFGTTGLVSWL